MEKFEIGEDVRLLRPIEKTGRPFWIFAGILLLVGPGGSSPGPQLRRGLSVTGLSVPVYWGIYITNFVFFIGISHAGTLISAILRLSHAEWRRSITRAAEVITVLVLFFGMGCVILDLGRPDRVLNVFRSGNFPSPLLWDVMSMSTYLIGQHGLSLPAAHSGHRDPARPPFRAGAGSTARWRWAGPARTASSGF